MPLRPYPLLLSCIAIATAAFAVGAYVLIGGTTASDPVPGTQDTAEAGAAAPTESHDALARQVTRRPRDGRAWVLLARADFEADRFAEAARAYEQAIAVSSKVASDPLVWCEYADALGMAQGGTLAGRPAELVQRALALDASHPKALELAGSAALERHDYAAALRYWHELAAKLPADTTRQRELAAAIARVEQMQLAAARPETARP